MQRKLSWSMAAITLLAVVLLAGPTVAIDTSVHTPLLPSDLDEFLRNSEAEVPNLREGVEKHVVWARADHRPTPVSLVYLHGFSATHREVYPLCDQLAQSLGANLFYSRLRGHGRDGEAMREVSVNALLSDASEALAIGQRIGERVILVGTSTGATLAAWLATQPVNDKVLALILISPNLGPRNVAAEVLLWPWAEYFAPLVAGPQYSFTPLNRAHAAYWTTRYPTSALLPMMGVVELLRSSDPTTIAVPVLVLLAKEDQIVSSDKTRAWFATLGTERKHLEWIDGADDPQQHVIAGDALSPSTTAVVAESILSFLEELGR
ncbi:MAG: hypothetical protein AMJ69_01055 [Gammaproteobacteria bacterium SG8_47]|nr:MAG: hypothetical protein AMJ69_01055 [Gammaproteobacteria bacterium SG8_47]